MKTPLGSKSVATYCDISDAFLKHFFLKIRNSKDGGAIIAGVKVEYVLQFSFHRWERLIILKKIHYQAFITFKLQDRFSLIFLILLVSSLSFILYCFFRNKFDIVLTLPRKKWFLALTCTNFMHTLCRPVNPMNRTEQLSVVIAIPVTLMNQCTGESCLGWREILGTGEPISPCCK